LACFAAFLRGLLRFKILGDLNHIKRFAAKAAKEGRKARQEPSHRVERELYFPAAGATIF
jgi:hypothetical protein